VLCSREYVIRWKKVKIYAVKKFRSEASIQNKKSYCLNSNCLFQRVTYNKFSVIFDTFRLR
jgi:hypothetical protein